MSSKNNVLRLVPKKERFASFTVDFVLQDEDFKTVSNEQMDEFISSLVDLIESKNLIGSINFMGNYE